MDLCPSPQQLVLNTPHLLEQIFDCIIFLETPSSESEWISPLNFSQIQVLRQVSKTWMQEIHRCVFKQNLAMLSPHPLSLVTLEDPGSVLRYISEVDSPNHCIDMPFQMGYNALNGRNTPNFIYFLQDYGYGLVSFVTRLSNLVPGNLHVSLNWLASLELPNLRFVSIIQDSECRTYYQRISSLQFVQGIVDAARAPLKINMEFRKHGFLSQTFASHFRFPRWTTHLLLTVGAEGVNYLKNLLYTNQTSFTKLECLSISNWSGQTLSSNILQQTLTACAGSLKTLILIGGSRWNNGIRAASYRLSRSLVVFPQIMNKLTYVSVSGGWLLGTDPLSTSCAQFPSVKKFYLGIRTTMEFDAWTKHSPFPCLEKLEIWGGTLGQLDILKVRNASPQLTCLYLRIGPEDGSEVLKNIFRALTYLKTLRVCVDSPSGINWDSTLIGCSVEEVTRLRQDFWFWRHVDFQEIDGVPSIRNLKGKYKHDSIISNINFIRFFSVVELQHFELYRRISVNEEDHKITDVAFELAFLKMEKLECVAVHSTRLVNINRFFLHFP